VQHGKALLEYLPVIPEAPEYKVCKDFLDNLCDLLKELEIGHIYAHADEQSKFMQNLLTLSGNIRKITRT
jgi:hypothetical protein